MSGFFQDSHVSRSVFLDVEFNDNEQHRPLLSLDLAETPSTRSVSLKYKVTSPKHTVAKSKPRIKYVPRYSQLILPLTQCAAVLSERFHVVVLCDPVPRPNLFPQ